MTRKARMSDNGSVAEILLFGDIGEGECSVSEVSLMLKSIPKSTREIVVRIHSDGGDVFQGIAIYNLLRGHGASIKTVNEGYAASAASYIFMAGDIREMKPASQLMIHEPEVGFMGRAEAVITVAESIAKTRSAVADVYASRSGQSVESVRKMMADETYMSAAEAVKLGFATAVSTEPADKTLTVAMLRRKALKMAKRRMEDLAVTDTVVEELEAAVEEAIAEEVPAEEAAETITISVEEYEALIALRDAAEVVADEAAAEVSPEASMEDGDEEEEKPAATAKKSMRAVRIATMKSERVRAAGIMSSCRMAGINDATALKFISNGASLQSVQQLCLRKMQDKNKPVAGVVRQMTRKTADPDQKFRDEYRGYTKAGYKMQSDEFDYVNSRRRDAGLPAHPRKK